MRAFFVIGHVVVPDFFIFPAAGNTGGGGLRFFSQDGVKKDPFQIFIFGIDALRRPNKRISHIGRIGAEQLMVDFKSLRLGKPHSNHDHAPGVSLPKRVRLPDLSDNAHHTEYDIPVVFTVSFEPGNFLHGGR